MDRVIFPTRAARTVRERVEARRARSHMRHAYPQDRYSLLSAARPEEDEEGGPYIPPPEIIPSSYYYAGRSIGPMTRSRSSGGTLPWVIGVVGKLARACLPTNPNAHSRPGDRTNPYRADTGAWAPPRWASPGGGSAAARSPWTGGGGTRGPGGGYSGGGFSSGGAGGLQPDDTYWGLGDVLHALRTRYVLEFVLAVVVVGVLAFSLLHSARRQPAVSAALGAETPTPEVTAAPKVTKPVRIMLLGSDRRVNDSGYRTDVMMLLTIDPAHNRASVLSFPRDLVGKIPGYGDGRINIVMGRGGFELMQDTFQESYGVRPDYYFLINFEGFVGLVNSIGGIEVKASKELKDSCDLPQSRAGVCTIKPGVHEMDGATALWYIRSRHSSSDFDRLRRAQEVGVGIFQKMVGMQALTRIPELYKQYTEDVETNMSLSQVIKLVPIAVDISKDTKKVKRYSISEDMTADWWMPDGARVLLPDYERVKEFARKVTYTK